MGGYKQITGSDGNTFSSTNQPANRGRKKKILTILKEQGYSAEDIRTGFKELAFYKKTELEKASNDESLPAILRIISNQYLMALKNCDYTKIKEILTHVLGAPSQRIEQTNLIDFSIDPFEKIRQINGIPLDEEE